jgi:hypothetical protein
MAATYLAAQVTVPSTITVVTSNNTILASRQQYRHQLAEGQSLSAIGSGSILSFCHHAASLPAR